MAHDFMQVLLQVISIFPPHTCTCINLITILVCFASLVLYNRNDFGKVWLQLKCAIGLPQMAVPNL